MVALEVVCRGGVVRAVIFYGKVILTVGNEGGSLVGFHSYCSPVYPYRVSVDTGLIYFSFYITARGLSE